MMTRNTLQACVFPVALALLAPGCADLDVPNLNALDLDTFEQSPTPLLASQVAVGLLVGHRVGKAAGNGFVSIVGVLGRESYNFDPADPRYRTELLEADSLNAGSPAFGGNYWTGPYSNIRNAHTLMRGVDRLRQPPEAISAEEAEGYRGVAKTIQALEFLTLITTRWDNGVPIDVDRAADGDLAPIESRDAVLAHISQLLDEAETHLQGAGASFAFNLGRGFAGFSTPAGFLQFNRAVAARVRAYSGQWDEVLTALDRSFLTPDGARLDVGVYHIFGTGNNDITNGLLNPNLYVHPSVAAAAELRPDGELDRRVTRKTAEIAPRSAGGGKYNADRHFTMYTSPESPLAILRNEELLLLKAEAHIGLEQYDEALTYINLIRTASGGLAPLGALDPETALDELLTQRFYSLLFEGGHRWIDMRRHGRLQDLLLADEVEGLRVHAAFPIPANEQSARTDD